MNTFPAKIIRPQKHGLSTYSALIAYQESMECKNSRATMDVLDYIWIHIMIQNIIPSLIRNASSILISVKAFGIEFRSL
jgi:hypothetical protein